MLVKLRLSLLVVFSSVAGYVIAAGTSLVYFDLLILIVGGFLTTAAANILNQVLEKDFDKLMTRTADRPLAADRMKSSWAVMLAGFSCLIGVTFLAYFNTVTALLGMVSMVLYAFVYTPMKRYSTLSVAIGAIPGALPIMIGYTAFSGQITWLVLGLFALQFLWQFPHFWAIGYLGFDDYKRAGYKLMPMDSNGSIARNLGVQVLLYCLLIIPVTVLIWGTGEVSLVSTVIALVAAAIYLYYSYRFMRSFDKTTARHTMFASFLYLPAMQLAYCIF